MPSLKKQIKSIQKKPFGKYLRRRQAEARADAFLLSFPKCGRTWLRIMLGRILKEHYNLQHPKLEKRILGVDKLHRLHNEVPRIHVEHDDWPHWKSPVELKQRKTAYRGRKVTLLIRDPRDVIVSLYFEQSRRLTDNAAARMRDGNVGFWRYRKRIRPYRRTLSEFIREDIGSFKTLVEYYNIWDRNREVPRNLLLLRYEDMHKNTPHTLRQVVEFLGLQAVADQVMHDAVEFARFENLRKMEHENTFQGTRMTPQDASDPESYKTRKGKVGGFADYLDEEDTTFLNRYMAKHLSPSFGYAS